MTCHLHPLHTHTPIRLLTLPAQSETYWCPTSPTQMVCQQTSPAFYACIHHNTKEILCSLIIMVYHPYLWSIHRKRKRTLIDQHVTYIMHWKVFHQNIYLWPWLLLRCSAPTIIFFFSKGPNFSAFVMSFIFEKFVDLITGWMNHRLSIYYCY